MVIASLTLTERGQATRNGVSPVYRESASSPSKEEAVISTGPRRQGCPNNALPALIICSVLVVPGCSAAKADTDSTVNSEAVQVGVVELRGMRLVAADDGEPVRILGILINESMAPTEVMISGRDDEVTVVVPANGEYSFDANETSFDSVIKPDGFTTISVATPAASTILKVPVLDATSDQFNAHLPTDEIRHGARSEE